MSGAFGRFDPGVCDAFRAWKCGPIVPGESPQRIKPPRGIGCGAGIFGLFMAIMTVLAA